MQESKKTILAIDDDNISLKLFSKILEEYNVITTTSGYEGLEILNTNEIDIILLDIVMPEIDGFELAKKIQDNKKLKKIPIIFITGNDSSKNLKIAFEIGGKDYIQKPLNPEQLRIRVQNQLKTIELEKKLRRKEQFFKTILNMQSNMITVLNKSKNKITFANKTFLDFFGMSDIKDFDDSNIDFSDLMIENENLFSKSKNDADSLSWIEELLSLDEHKRNVAFANKRNETKIFRISITKFEESDYILSFTDISETLKSNFDLKKKVNIDKLTKAYTREYFYENIIKIHDSNKEKNKLTCLAFFDIDKFKQINDTYGHKVGDTVLIELISCVKHHTRNEDLIFRWGGEEFILVFNIPDEKYLFNIIDTLRTNISKYEFSIVMNLTASFGATIFNGKEDIDEAILRADKAMYEAKNSGRNNTKIF